MRLFTALVVAGLAFTHSMGVQADSGPVDCSKRSLVDALARADG
jgi:hypothetical protein